MEHNKLYQIVYNYEYRSRDLYWGSTHIFFTKEFARAKARELWEHKYKTKGEHLIDFNIRELEIYG